MRNTYSVAFRGALREAGIAGFLVDAVNRDMIIYIVWTLAEFSFAFQIIRAGNGESALVLYAIPSGFSPDLVVIVVEDVSLEALSPCRSHLLKTSVVRRTLYWVLNRPTYPKDDTDSLLGKRDL